MAKGLNFFPTKMYYFYVPVHVSDLARTSDPLFSFLIESLNPKGL